MVLPVEGGPGKIASKHLTSANDELVAAAQQPRARGLSASFERVAAAQQPRAVHTRAACANSTPRVPLETTYMGIKVDGYYSTITAVIQKKKKV